MGDIEKYYDNTEKNTPRNNVRYFVGNFFGVNDSWNMTKRDMSFFSQEQVISLFKDFEIVFFKEFENDGLTGLGKMKHWHVFDVIAKRK